MSDLLTSDKQFESFVTSHIDPAILQYYREWLEDSMKTPLKAFKAACIFLPWKVQEMQFDASSIDELAVFLFLDNTAV